jgi:predicted ATPase/DNA-binding SARP family transcriptional activator/DNA-binding CsgD family transcriptional regulator/predicted negative regulator of RcsB-dependent stress response
MAERPIAYKRPGSKDIRGGAREAIRVKLLGEFSVSVGDREIGHSEWRLKKAAALVKLLALAPGHRMHREQTMDLLWPASGRKAASNSLRKTLHAARRTLDQTRGSDYLASQDESLVLCPGGDLWVDVDAFEDSAATARRSKDPAAYRAALDLHAGELLPEDRYEEWAEGRRSELRQLYLALVIELASVYEEREEYARAIEALGKVTSKEPTLEEAHASIMRLHALSGRPERALAQYERLRDALQKGIGTPPTEATRHLRDEIATGRLLSTLPSDPAHPVDSDASKHNLPAPMSSFVGREQEMVEVKRELAMTRLLTLTGAGGTGKTRLALEVARDLVGAFPAGVWMVELASITEPRLAAQEVAGTLGVQERPGEPLTDTIAEALAAKELLLVLDNCEHLVEEAARLVARLLASCPYLKVLATSREPLALPGEVNWAVPPLSLPATPNGGTTADVLMRYEAVRLFVDRARLRLLDFEVTLENAGAVARVCRKLEGIPLAIELATARMGALAVEQVAQKLETSLDVLKGTNRSAAPRQQTLRATLDWSHDLLSDDERVFLRRLSVFAGGWTLEAAEIVCSRDGIEREDGLDLLGGLVDKSLVVAGASAGGAVRCRLLEPVRQYASEKLEESGEARVVRYRHASFFLSLAEEADPALEGSEQPRWLDRLEEEHDNIRAALAWLLQQAEDAEIALRMGAALGWFWYLRGHIGEGRRWLEAALATPALPSAAHARALQRAAWLALLQGDLDRSEAASQEGLELEGIDLFKTAGGDSIAADLQGTLAMALADRNEFDRAIDLLDESLARSREVGSVRGTAVSLFRIGIVRKDRSDVERSLPFFEEALAMFRKIKDPATIASVLTHLGDALLFNGDIDRARAVSEEAETMLREQNHRHYLVYALTTLGWVALVQNDAKLGRTSFTEGLKLSQKLGAKEAVLQILEGLACIAATLGEPRRAARLLGAVQALQEATGLQQEPSVHALEDAYLLAARPRQDEESWVAALEEGRAMMYEEAVEYALSEVEPIQPTLEESPASTRAGTLTPREREIAGLVTRGLTNRQIASELVISEHTAATHVAKILKKLGLKSRAQIGSRLSEQQGSAQT